MRGFFGAPKTHVDVDGYEEVLCIWTHEELLLYKVFFLSVEVEIPPIPIEKCYISSISSIIIFPQNKETNHTKCTKYDTCARYMYILYSSVRKWSISVLPD